MASTQAQREGVAQVAGRILMAWRNGEESACLLQELAQVSEPAPPATASTLEMERLEALSGVVESLKHGRRQAGAVRLLEHLAGARDAGLCHASLFEVSR